MHSIIYLTILFIAKVIDNAINTTKTIMIQRSRWVLAGIAVILSDFIYFWIMRNVVTVYCKIELPKVADGNWRMLHLQIGESCKIFAKSSQERCSA